jgi:hypothetical protein
MSMLMYEEARSALTVRIICDSPLFFFFLVHLISASLMVNFH